MTACNPGTGTCLESTPMGIFFPLYSHLTPSDSISHQWINERDGCHFLRLHFLQGEKPPLDFASRPGSDLTASLSP